MASTMCRSCLIRDPNNKPMDILTKGAILNLTGIIICENDSVPQAICQECHRLLEEFVEFRNRIINNNNFLLNSISKTSNIIKIENDQLNGDQETNIETQDIKLKILKCSNSKLDADIEEKPMLKKEIEVMFLNEIDHCDDFRNECGIKKKKARVKKKKKISQNSKPIVTPRNIVYVDPEKITVIKLNKEEQMKRQKLEAERSERREMPYRCDKCHKGFNYERKLDSHNLKYHKPNSEFECSICKRTMSNAASLKLHESKHEHVYECNICGCSFVEKLRATSHFKSVHEGIEADYPCKQCDKVFKNRSTLNGHIRNHHPSAERPKCPQCEKSFMTKDSLDDHMLIHSGEKNYSCSICGARFRLRQCARTHALSHRAVRPHRCVPCDVSFKCRAALRHHLLTARAHVTPHLMAKNTCVNCGRQFPTRYALCKHELTHSDSVYTCRVCGETVRVGNKRGHDRRHRGPGVGRIVAVCHYCGKGFTARRTLESHMLTHTGARPHACSCGSKFAQRATLRNHLRATKHTLVDIKNNET